MDANRCGNEDVELLEDCWFFGNLLHTKSKPKILRSLSDPCSSSNFAGKSYEETYESINKLSSSSSSLNRTATKERGSKGKTQLKNSLIRAPSLPTSLETEDFHDEEEEVEFSMGKLIRQASLNTRPLRRSNPKISRLKQHKSEVNKLTAQMSLTDVEIQELRGFNDLGFDLERNRRLPERRATNEEKEDKRTARLCPSEAWAPPPPPPPPPVPRWGGKRSTEEMKAQIKFWARAVASNVRQEC